MILYHGSTTYHVLCCIVHKLVYHENEDAVLFLVEHLYPKKELPLFIDRLRDLGWFKEVYIVPEGEFARNRTKKLNQKSTTEEIESQCRSISEAFIRWCPYSMDQFEEINLLGEQWSMGIYILSHRIPHQYFEDGSGLLGDYRRYFQVIRDINLTNYILLRHLGGGGKNQFVLKKYCDMKNQPAGFTDKLATDFSVYEHLKIDLVGYQKKCIRLFQGSHLYLPEGTTVMVFLTQFIRTLSIQSFEIQKRFTSLIIDYFFKEDILLIKPHPKDKWIDYQKLFPEAILLERRLPSEFLPFIFKRNVEWTATASSTSIGGMSYITDHLLSFGQEMESDFNRLHSSYVVAKLIEKLVASHFGILILGKKNFIKEFLYKWEISLENEKATQERKLIVADDACQNGNEKDVIVYLEQEVHNQFLFDKTKKEDCYLVVQVNLIDLKDSLYNWSEQVWIYSEDMQVRKELMSMSERLILDKSQVEVEIEVQEATKLMIEQGKNRALQYVLSVKNNEDRDPILKEMNTLIGLYQKENAMYNQIMAQEGYEGFR